MAANKSALIVYGLGRSRWEVRSQKGRTEIEEEVVVAGSLFTAG